MKRAIIISGSLAQDHEFIYPFYRLLEENFELDICLNEEERVKEKGSRTCKTTSFSAGDDLPPLHSRECGAGSKDCDVDSSTACASSRRSTTR